MSDASYISIQNVSKSFGKKVHAVRDVSIDIARGEFFSLLGPSGCGKTTLLRMLAGLEFPTSGEIFIVGQPMSAVPANRRPVGMVFQSYAIFPHLTVAQNIGYSLRRDRLPKADFNARVAEMLAMIRLSGYEERGAHQLSGGERQRVALARALIRRPKVLLLDEPLGALDKKLREQMQLELRQIQRSLGITFVFVTHDQEEALTMSDRIAVMSKGRYLQIDTPTQLYETPKSRTVADFIGTINFFPASVAAVEGSRATIDVAGLGSLSALVRDQQLASGSPILAAIRPEKLLISTEAPTGGNAVKGTLNDAAYLGDRSHFFVQLAGQEDPVAVSAQNLRQEHELEIGGPRDVWLTWDSDAVVLLPDDRAH
ncbi:MAG: ABC transporter ATP-binding protein [Pseudomonadota bacterium]